MLLDAPHSHVDCCACRAASWTHRCLHGCPEALLPRCLHAMLPACCCRPCSSSLAARCQQGRAAVCQGSEAGRVELVLAGGEKQVGTACAAVTQLRGKGQWGSCGPVEFWRMIL